MKDYSFKQYLVFMSKFDPNAEEQAYMGNLADWLNHHKAGETVSYTAMNGARRVGVLQSARLTFARREDKKEEMNIVLVLECCLPDWVPSGLAEHHERISQITGQSLYV